MREVILKITEEGEVFLLYDDDMMHLLARNNLQVIPTVIRASNVVYDNQTQKWRIHENLPDGSVDIWPMEFDRRDEAIKAEITGLSALLWSTDFAEQMFKGVE